jgi:hypothetical protein
MVNDPAGIWARRLVYLVVLIPVTAAAAIGLVKVRYFAPLVSAFPDDLQAFLMVLVSAVIGGVAVLVRLLAARSPKKKGVERVRRRNQWLGVICVIVFIATLILIALHLTSWVARVDYNGGKDTAQFVIGGGERLAICGCPPEISAGECIEGLSLDKTKVESCWGDKQINRAKWILTVEYLLALLFVSLAVSFLTLIERKKHAVQEQQALRRNIPPPKE